MEVKMINDALRASVLSVKLIPNVDAKMAEELNLPNVSIQQAGDFYLEITHKKAKKSVGIDYIIKEEKLHKKELVAFGDGHNDLPMFERVGLSIAMENASQAIKDKVSLITKTNDEDGVGYGIHHFLL